MLFYHSIENPFLKFPPTADPVCLPGAARGSDNPQTPCNKVIYSSIFKKNRKHLRE
jgi:hypothetical protein